MSQYICSICGYSDDMPGTCPHCNEALETLDFKDEELGKEEKYPTDLMDDEKADKDGLVDEDLDMEDVDEIDDSFDDDK